jgi:hypothetical protein
MIATTDDQALIAAIAARAARELQGTNLFNGDVVELEADIKAVHLNDLPLDLPAFLAADDYQFVHDILSIQQNIDRTTGQLRNFVIPRYAL